MSNRHAPATSAGIGMRGAKPATPIAASTDGATSARWGSAGSRRGRSTSELWEPDHLHEELVDLTHRVHELVEVDRLGHVCVGVQLVAAQDVLLGRRGG